MFAALHEPTTMCQGTGKVCKHSAVHYNYSVERARKGEQGLLWSIFSSSLSLQAFYGYIRRKPSYERKNQYWKWMTNSQLIVAELCLYSKCWRLLCAECWDFEFSVSWSLLCHQEWMNLYMINVLSQRKTFFFWFFYKRRWGGLITWWSDYKLMELFASSLAL